MVRHAPPSSDRTARPRPPPASSSPRSRSRSEGPPFSDLATTAAAWCTSSTGLGPSTTTNWNWVTGLSWRTCPRSRFRARPVTGSPWRRCLDPDRSRPPAKPENRSTISGVSFFAERSGPCQDRQAPVRSFVKKSDRPSGIQPAATTATRGHRWRCGEEEVVDHRVDDHRHDDVEEDQLPPHSVCHVLPLLSCRPLRLHGQDYYRDSINQFFDGGRRPRKRPTVARSPPCCVVEPFAIQDVLDGCSRRGEDPCGFTSGGLHKRLTRSRVLLWPWPRRLLHTAPAGPRRRLSP